MVKQKWKAKEPGPAGDLVVSATAFHWIDPSIGYRKAGEVLRSGGSLALWWSHHVKGANDQGFFDEVQPLYRESMPASSWKDLLEPQAFGDRAAEIASTRLFGEVHLRRYLWNVTYTTREYTDLLATYSDHILLDPTAWDRRANLIDTPLRRPNQQNVPGDPPRGAPT